MQTFIHSSNPPNYPFNHAFISSSSRQAQTLEGAQMWTVSSSVWLRYRMGQRRGKNWTAKEHSAHQPLPIQNVGKHTMAYISYRHKPSLYNPCGQALCTQHGRALRDPILSHSTVPWKIPQKGYLIWYLSKTTDSLSLLVLSFPFMSVWQTLRPTMGM